MILENFEDTCINTAIDTISATIASTSKNGRKSKKYLKNSQEEVIEIRSLIKTFYLMTMT